MTPCPVCGKTDGACGEQPLVFPPIDIKKGSAMADDKPIYVPEQKVRRGVAGYRGDNIVVVSADGTPKPAPKGKGEGKK